jgi:carotenoid cleavage dioxygenase-like enzyme
MNIRFELPTINPNYKTSRNRYVYGTGIQSSTSSYLDNILKVDVDAGQVLHVWNQKSMYPGEALFVPRPNSTQEDDGVLLSIVRDVSGETQNSSFLLILNAQTFEEVARVKAPYHIPAGIHGTYIDRNDN